MVLNELNNLKVHGEAISEEEKQDIYNTLFKKGKKVSIGQIESYFKNAGKVGKEESDFLSGIDLQGFKSSLSSFGKFRGIFGDDAFRDDYIKMEEDIIFWATIYGNDKKFLKSKLEEVYGDVLTDEKVIKRILGFKFEGWGNLSKEFLLLEGGSKKDGCKRTIIEALWETNDNLMQLLSSDYTYIEELNSKMKKQIKDISEWSMEDLDAMYLSAPVKRMVWQTLKIMKDIQFVTGRTPDRIFVEMPREDGEKGKRTESRKKKLMDLYGALKTEEKLWKSDIEQRSEAEFRMKKLYLYYIQMGKCMYTGETIDLYELLNNNTKYDIDHIYPQHYVKDDSLDNNNVLVLKTENGRKSDEYPLNRDIQSKMQHTWKFLLDKGFMTPEKYKRLTRTQGFSEEELADFINRQLVETRQGTKAITQIIQQSYPNAEVIFSKAGVVSNFRKRFDLLKVRSINDFHHAKDAYLNIVVGNTYYVKFTKNPLNFIREARGNYSGKYAYHMDKIFLYDVTRNEETAWIAPTGKNKEEKLKSNTGSIKTVRKMMSKNTPLITKRCYIDHGGITREDTIYGKAKAKEQVYLPVTSSNARLSDVTKYGGRTSIHTQCYALVSYKVKGKQVLSLEALPIFIGNVEEIPDASILNYLQKAIQFENGDKQVTELQLKLRCIRYKSLIKINGFYYCITGRTKNSIYLDNAESLILDDSWNMYIKKLEKANSTNQYENQYDNMISSEKNVELYCILLYKLTNSIYKNKKASIIDSLEKGRLKFEKLDLSQQVYTLMQIVSWFGLKNIAIDLSYIDAGAHAGVCVLNKKIQDCKEAKLYITSPTGLYRKEIDLLSL
jgi:CRISPR-associated endonuclease Csn1